MRIVCWWFLLLCVLLCSCGDNTPLQPVGFKTPTLIPLTQGASWEYRYSYHYHNYDDYANPIINIDETLTGKYTVTVENSLISGDSVVYSIDTVTEPDLGARDSVESWEILLHSDSLWYMLDGAWKYMSTAVFVDGSSIDIRVFLPPVGLRYDLQKGTVIRSGHKISDNYYDYSNSDGYVWVRVNASGVEQIHTFWSVGITNIQPEWMQKEISLVSYTPGTP